MSPWLYDSINWKTSSGSELAAVRTESLPSSNNEVIPPGASHCMTFNKEGNLRFIPVILIVLVYQLTTIYCVQK